VAVFYNFSIDCGDNEQSARELVAAYDGLVIKLPGFDDIICEAWYGPPGCHLSREGQSFGCGGENGNWHKVCVDPVGVSQPNSNGITAYSNLFKVQKQLHSVLLGSNGNPPHKGYRVAIFGAESQDELLVLEWPDTLTKFNETGKIHHFWKGMIFAEECVLHEELRKKLVPFSDGYLWYPGMWGREVDL